MPALSRRDSWGSPLMLLTLQEAAGRLRTPRRRLRELVNEHRIAFVRTGKKKVMIPDDAIDRFIAEETVEPTCRAGTQDRVFASLKGEDAITSSGRKAVAAASAARALQISQKRKGRLASSSPPGPGEAARVIPMKRS
jgi:excisionase family DNA binding protein